METDYPENSVKQDPETKIIAQRTAFSGDRAWRVHGLHTHYVAHADVEHWRDLGLVDTT